MLSFRSRLSIAAVLLAMSVIGFSMPVFAQSEYDKFNAAIHRELQAKDPAAAKLFRQADDARLRGDHRTAAYLYKLVVERVPGFVHAIRRQAMEEVSLGQRRTGLKLLESAVSLDPSAENLAAFATALVQTNGEASPTDADLARAGDLARRACTLKPNDADILEECVHVAFARADREALDSYLTALARVEPDAMRTHYLSVLAAWERGEFDRALAALERARAAGLPASDYDTLRASITAARPLGPRVIRWLEIGLGSWIGGAALLFGTGLVLSAIAIRASTGLSGRIGGHPTARDVLIRRVYRVVLFASCAYYYLSIPLLLAIVLVGGGGLLYGMLSVGHLPIRLILVVVIAIFVTVSAIVRSLFIRGSHDDPGVRIHPDEHRRLWRLLADVAERVGTRPVDSVYLTPGTEVAVFERGGLWRQIAGRGERCLILGVGTLDGMSLGAFKAVIAHEYGHFSNRDTAGGGFALAVRRSAVSLAANLARGGAASWVNPAWLFVSGFYHLFLRISQGASRLQEVLADRWAATLYGAPAFESGLRHVIDRSVRFNAHVNQTVQDVVVRKLPLKNLYQYTPTTSVDAAELETLVRGAFEAEPSPYDSHPRPVDRFRWVHELDVQVEPEPEDESSVWSLFDDRTVLEERMTTVVRDALAGLTPAYFPS
jgi:Zn-dependent protease with chaperone function